MNGHWFDGGRFVDRTMYTADGVFTDEAHAANAKTVDLAGAFVVPPFGDAHHHGIDSEGGLDAKIAAFLDAGIFYVKNPNVIPDLLTPAVRARINRADSIDVSFSNGGLTGTGGHPAPLHDMLAKHGVFGGMGPGDMENHAYFFIDTQKDLDTKWPRILAGKPDFIKTFLVFSDGKLPPGMPPERGLGLKAAMLPPIVQRAHAAGLRVSTHVTSAVDFGVAVDAGVDEVNHLPFFFDLPFCRKERAQCFLDADIAKRAAAHHTVAVTTQAPHEGEPQGTPAEVEETIAGQRANFQTLAKAGVAIALGSDGISGEVPFATARDEALFLQKNAFADNLALLKMWSETTAATIFPARKLGHLDGGYEASFLVLEGNPIADFANVKRIRARIKQGHEMARPNVATQATPRTGG